MPPIVRVQRSCNNRISIPGTCTLIKVDIFSTMKCVLAVSDSDGDDIRCRWASSSQQECSGVCQAFPATLSDVRSVVTITLLQHLYSSIVS